MKYITFLGLLIFVSACKKKDKSEEPIPTTPDVGLNYQAKTVCNFTLNDALLLNAGYTKVFEDNFDSNLSNWSYWTTGSYNNELQYYQPANLQISTGALGIVARKETATGAATPVDKSSKTFKYTSGRIESKNVFSANDLTPKVRIAARIKLPKGFGMCPAFLSFGDNWPTQGQIDLVVAYGQNPTQYITNYYYATKPVNNDVRGAFGYITADADLTDCYHIFETEWTRTALTYYLDGKLVETKTTGGHIPDLYGKKQRLCFYLAVSSSFISRGQIETGTMYIDWVKVFTSK